MQAINGGVELHLCLSINTLKGRAGKGHTPHVFPTGRIGTGE